MAADGLIKRFNNEVGKIKEVEKDREKAVSSRRQLEAQLTENSMVKEVDKDNTLPFDIELDLLEAGATVYKLTGPVLIKQDLTEAKQNVSKRIEFINSEIRRQEAHLKDLDKKQKDAQEAAMKIQQQLQQAKVKMAMKS